MVDWAVDNAFLREQAERCRTLAEKADPSTRSRLLDLAASYDDRLGQASRATRSLGSLLETQRACEQAEVGEVTGPAAARSVQRRVLG